MNFNLCSCVVMCVSASQETVARVGCALQSESWPLKASLVSGVAGFIAAELFIYANKKTMLFCTT